MTINNYQSLSNDCYGSDGALFTGVDNMYLGYTTASTAPKAKTWIPFTVTLPKMQKIISAILSVTAYSTLGGDLQANFGCEAADNPSTPVSWADINSRVQTTALLAEYVVPNFTIGNVYTFDITSSVQEILNRSGWVNGNTLAAFIIGFDHSANVGRRIATFEHASLAEPQLSITYPILPRGSSL